MGRYHRVSDAQWHRRIFEMASLLAEEALSEATFAKLLDMLACELRGSSSLLDYDAGERRIEFASRGIEPNEKLAYAEHFHAINPFTAAVLSHRLYNHTYVGSRVVDQSTLVRTEFYNDWLRHRGERYLLVLSLGFGDGGRTGLPIYRGEAEGGDFSTEDVRRLDMLRPFLKNALTLRRVCRRLAASNRSV